MLLEPGGRSSGPLYCSVGCLSGQFGLLDCGALDTAPLWRYGIRRRRGNVACCQLASQYTARLGSAESSVDDFDTCRGDVLIRAVTILRYIESQPSTGRFVMCKYHTLHLTLVFQILFSHLTADVMHVLLKHMSARAHMCAFISESMRERE